MAWAKVLLTLVCILFMAPLMVMGAEVFAALFLFIVAAWISVAASATMRE